MFKVLVTRKLPGNHLEWLAERCELEIYPYDQQPMPRALLLQKVAHVHGLISLVTDRIDQEVIQAAPQLKVVSNYAVGYNNIDVEFCTQHGIQVCNTPGVLTDTTADCAFALLLAVARRVVEADRYVRQAQFKGWFPSLMMGADVHHKTLGIIGMGRIGRAVAQRALGFGMRVLVYDTGKQAQSEAHLMGMEHVSFNDLLQQADFVSLHVPLLPSTHHLIDAQALAQMKSTAILINTSRGPVVDEKALAWALRSGGIAGAGLDVYEDEPVVLPALIGLDNVVLLPHIGSSSVATREEMTKLAVMNLWKTLSEGKPLHAVNKI